MSPSKPMPDRDIPHERLFIEGVGHICIELKSTLDGYECRCGDPQCDGSAVEIVQPCHHQRQLVYFKKPGVLASVCYECGNALGWRLAERVR